MPVAGRHEIALGVERMEEGREFKYIRTVLTKHGEMEGEIVRRL